MRTFRLAVLALIVMPVSQAWSGETNGVIVSVDADARSITLESGETFIVKDLVDRFVLKVGQRVRITHEPTPEGLNAASIVVPQG